MKKTCKIINDKFSWVLEVDNFTILFQGGRSADYFADHYKELGYDVQMVLDRWEEDEKPFAQ